jgi:hypothetical protein
MSITYEWVCEYLSEDDEILDIDHSDNPHIWDDIEDKHDVALVRESFLAGGKVWGYVKDGKLPEFFSDLADHVTSIKVPKKYKKQLQEK